MPYKTVIAARKQAQKLLMEATRLASERHQETQALIRQTVAQIQIVMADDGFLNVLQTQQVASLPKVLVSESVREHVAIKQQQQIADRFGENCLTFVIAWSFLYPLFSNPAVGNYLNANWPGFIAAMKDTFISAIVTGPFPNRGRGPNKVRLDPERRPSRSTIVDRKPQ